MYFKDKNPSVQAFKLGFFFFLLFSSYSSFQNIVTHVYQQRNLTAVGPLILISNYLTFLISNTLAVNSKISFKIQMIIGSIMYSINMGVGIFIKEIQSTIIVYGVATTGAIIGGASAGFLWVSQGGYLREICRGKQNKGKYNGIFTLMFSSSQLMAGIVTTFFFGLFSQQIYFIALTTISFSSTIFGIFFLQNISQSTSKQTQNKNNSNQSSNSIQSDSTKLNNITKNNQKNNYLQQSNIKQNVIKSLKFYTKMIPLLIFLIIDGIILGIQSNQIPKLIVKGQGQTDSDYNLKVGILTIFIGAGSFISSSLNGVICDKFGLKMAGRFTLLFYVTTCIITALQIAFLPYFWLACIITFTWGFSYFLFQGFIYVSILKIYQGKLQAFAINKQVHCLSMAAFQIFVIFTRNEFDLSYLMYFIIILVIPAVYSLSKIDFDKEGKLNNSQNERKKQILESLVEDEEE